MKIEPQGTPSTAHPKDITPEFEAGTEPRVHRRTTVTVERETISVLVRRSVVEPVTESGGEQMASGSPDKNLPEAPPEMPNGLAGDKP